MKSGNTVCFYKVLDAMQATVSYCECFEDMMLMHAMHGACMRHLLLHWCWLHKLSHVLSHPSVLAYNKAFDL